MHTEDFRSLWSDANDKMLNHQPMLMRSDAFSAIIIATPFVLHDTKFGAMELSQTRKP